MVKGFLLLFLFHFKKLKTKMKIFEKFSVTDKSDMTSQIAQCSLFLVFALVFGCSFVDLFVLL